MNHRATRYELFSWPVPGARGRNGIIRTPLRVMKPRVFPSRMSRREFMETVPPALMALQLREELRVPRGDRPHGQS